MCHRIRGPSLGSSGYVYYCPHGEDNVYLDKKGCRFEGSLDALNEHLEVCKYEAAEVRQLADSMACYLRKKSSCAAEIASIAKLAIDRLAREDLDERRVEIIDTVDREILVRGLDVQPMLEQFVRIVHAPKNTVKEAWKEFLKFCLPGFRPVQLSVPRRKGGRLIEDMLEAQLRDVEDKAQQGYFFEDQHSHRVWSLAIQAAVSAAAVCSEMDSTLSNATIDKPRRGTVEIRIAQIKESVGIGGGGDLMKVLQIFKLWDVDHNGSISRDELSALLTSLDSGITPADADRLFSAADVNHDERIDYAEFVAWLLK